MSKIQQAFDNIDTFMKASGQTTEGVNPQQTGLYRGLVFEEIHELLSSTNDIQELDGMADIIVTIYGLAKSAGYDLDGAMLAVTENNLTKIVDGVVLKDASGKVQKPEGYKSVDLTAYVPEPSNVLIFPTAVTTQ